MSFTRLIADIPLTSEASLSCNELVHYGKSFACCPPMGTFIFLSLLSSDRHSFTMRPELGRVHALDCCEPDGEPPFMAHEQRVFEDVSAFRDCVEKEIGGGIPCTLIVSQCAFPAVSAEYIHGLCSGGAHILQVDIFHVSVAAELDAYDEFVPYAE